MWHLQRLLVAGIIVFFSCPVFADSGANLLIAATNGDTKAVNRLLAQRVSVDPRSEKGQTPLILAASNGHHPVVQALLQHGADVHAQTKAGWTALLNASHFGHVLIVEHLLKKGAAVNHSLTGGWTPLLVASGMGHGLLIPILLQHGAQISAQLDTGETALYLAAQNGHLQVVDVLLANQAPVNVPRADGMTPLFVAVQNNQVEVVEKLLAHGATVDLPRKEGTTPLYLAAQKGHAKVVELLLAKGADHQFVWNLGWTPLLIASEHGHLSTVKILLAHGANVKHQGTSGETAIWLAAQNGHADLIALLAQQGAEVNTPAQGWTPLMVAALEGHETAVFQLLALDADVHRMNSDGVNALFVAKTSAIATRLQEAGATLQTKTSSTQAQSPPQAVMEGNLVNGVYRNSRVGWTFQMPTGWRLFSPEELAKHMEIGWGLLGESSKDVSRVPWDFPLLAIRKDARTYFLSMAQRWEGEARSSAELAKEELSTIREVITQRSVYWNHEPIQEKMGAQVWEGVALSIYTSAQKETPAGKLFFYFGHVGNYMVSVQFMTVDPADEQAIFHAWRSSTFAKAKP